MGWPITDEGLGDAVKLVGKGLDTGKVYEPVLNDGQLHLLVASPEPRPFDGDPLHFRLYVVYNCAATPRVHAIRNSARLGWQPLVTIEHYHLDANKVLDASCSEGMIP